MDVLNTMALCLDKESPYTVKKKLLESRAEWDTCVQKLDETSHRLTDRKLSLDLGAAERELNVCEQNKINFCFLGDQHYPAKMSRMDDPPLVLFYKGNGELNNAKTISVVGTRNATAYGKQLTGELIEGLAGSGITVVSGLAYGIDSIAHAEALKWNLPTWGVLAHGLQTIYPSQHRNLARDMEESGGVLTEYAFNTPVLKFQFPLRNRIIAGMSDATVIIEASKKGGALITATWANQYNIDVFAFPGNITQTYSLGCNHIIKNKEAQLIESAQDLMYYMNWEGLFSQRSEDLAKKRNNPEIIKFSEKRDEELYNTLKGRMQWSINEIQDLTKLDFSMLYIRLWALEEKGIIRLLPGNTVRIL